MPERSEGRHLGRYLIRRRLGTGGFARVYLAFDPDLEFEVALKVLKAQYADDPAAVERFRREATTAVRLRHPNVVTVLAVGRLDEEFDGTPAGAPYLVMDYLPDSLASRLAATPALPEAEVRRIGAEVARGLAYAHQAGVVHRDVKPDNVLFGRDGQAVVTDFGIARAVADTLAPATRSAVVGTPSYFSPEQARGLPLDGRTDIYALGVTLYQAATGALPFTGEDWYSVMRQHVEDPPTPPRTRNPALSPELDGIILRALAKDPADRFPTAGAMADALAGVTGSTRVAGPMLEERDTHQTVVIDPYEGSRASTQLAARDDHGGRRWVVAGGVVGVALAASVLLLIISQSSVPEPTSIPGPVAEAPADSPGVAIDSLAANGPFAAPLRGFNDSLLRVAPTPATLMVLVPAAAELRVNGTPVGPGSWSSDTLPAGRYTVQATIAPSGECPGSESSETVTLVPGQPREVRLRLRRCGTLSIVAAPSGARYSLVPRDGGASRDGRLPLTRPLVLLEGTYQLVVSAPTCTDFRQDDLQISAGSAITTRTPLICG